MIDEGDEDEDEDEDEEEEEKNGVNVGGTKQENLKILSGEWGKIS